MSISAILLLLSILIIPLLAAFVFKSKADKLKEQKPVQFIIYNVLIFFSPLIVITLQVCLFRLSDIGVPNYYHLFLFIAGLAVIFVIRFLIIREEWFQIKQFRKKNKELAKIYSIFTTGLVLTLTYPIIFTGEAAIKVYLLGLLILVYWIYAIYTILIVSKKLKIM